MPDLRTFVDADPPRWRAFVDLAVADGSPGEGCVVVGHSGAGAFLPAIADRLPQGFAAIVFVDAVLPPTEGGFSTDPSMRRALEERTEGRLLRPWTTWWDSGVVERILPDRELRSLIEDEQPMVPISVYDEVIPMPDRWSQLSCAYLRLSSAYDDELSEARARGWPAIALQRSHLAMMTHSDDVAAAIQALCGRI